MRPLADIIRVYDETAQNYSKGSGHVGPEQDKFIKLVKPQGKILDVGCGNGKDVLRFKKEGLDVIGIDLCKALLDLCKEQDPTGKYILTDIRNLYFAEASVDGIWSCASLVHLERHDIVAVINSFYKILKKNGILCIITTAGTGEITKYDRIDFTLVQLKEMSGYFENAGFQIVEAYEYNELKRGTGKRDVNWVVLFGRK